MSKRLTEEQLAEKLAEEISRYFNGKPDHVFNFSADFFFSLLVTCSTTPDHLRLLVDIFVENSENLIKKVDWDNNL